MKLEKIKFVYNIEPWGAAAQMAHMRINTSAYYPYGNVSEIGEKESQKVPKN